VRKALGPAAIVLGGLLLSGCAAGRAASLSGRLVHPGEPLLQFDGLPVGAQDAGDVERVSAPRPSRQGTFGATIESFDPGLAAALLVEAALPTAQNHLRVAEEYRRLGVLDTAFERLTRAVDKQPRLPAAHEGIAKAWRDWGLPARALSAAYRAAYHDPQSAGAQNTLGTVLDALGQLEQARAAYNRALVLDPTAAWALNNLCYLEFRLGRLGEARSHCEAAIRLDPGLAAAHNNLGLIHGVAGDLRRARAEFLAGGDAATAQYNLGIVYLAHGNDAAAAAAFEQAIQARPDFTAAKARAHAARLRLLIGSN